ncbi:MAG: FGGY family carbohydrate kinase [Gammaproteobacteria bacterium]|nr:FGGY family carbohydrate kinase [Gammaproteobacteria bacterium]
MPYILVIDQGTHASRAMLFSSNGEIVDKAKVEIKLQQLNHTHIEQDPEEILTSIITALGQLDKSRLSDTHQCCITTQRSTVLAWNSTTGEALSPAISWQDRRSLDDLQQFKPQEKQIKAITGLPLSPHYAAGKCRWLIQHNPQVQQALLDQQLQMGTLVSFLLYHLISGNPHLIDHSNANRTLLFDLAALQWSEKLFHLFDLPHAIFPECKPMLYHYGKLNFHPIPVTAVSGDQSAALHAQGVVQQGHAIINIGTGAFVLAPCDNIITNTDLLCGIGLTTDTSCTYLLEGTVNGAGAALSWAEQKYPVSNLFQQLPDWLDKEQSPPIFINTIGGLGSPWWKSGCPAYFIDDQSASIEARFVGVIESIVFLLQTNLEQMQQHINLQQLKISGGLSQLDELCQKLADLSKLPIARMTETEATAKGAAWLAAGCPSDWHKPQTEQIFLPRSQPELVARYQKFCHEIHSL